MSQLAYGKNIQAIKLRGCTPSNHKQIPDRKNPQFFWDFIRKKRMHFVGLFKIRGHLGQKFVGGNSYITVNPRTVLILLAISRAISRGFRFPKVPVISRKDSSTEYRSRRGEYSYNKSFNAVEHCIYRE